MCGTKTKKANWAISLCTDLITVCVPVNSCCLNVFETQETVGHGGPSCSVLKKVRN